jgi:hypothetical protein
MTMAPEIIERLPHVEGVLAYLTPTKDKTYIPREFSNYS